MKDYIQCLESSIFNFVEPGKPEGDYRGSIEGGDERDLISIQTDTGFPGSLAVWTFLAQISTGLLFLQ